LRARLLVLDDQHLVISGLTAQEVVTALSDVGPNVQLEVIDIPQVVPPPRKPTKNDKMPLTTRELQVLAMIARGHTNQQIADSLYLSINSVKTYIRSAYRKIGVTSRAQAAIWAAGCPSATTSRPRPESPLGTTTTQ
jgi:DNA-binding NarL/FixJ family response regulator